jgi:hypothetical protein
MERATKLAIVLAAIGLLAFDLAIGRAWVGMAPAGLALFLAAAAATALDRRAVGLALMFAFVFPVIVKLTLDTYAVQFSVLWMAALLGAIVPDALRTPWHVPRRWRAPLVLAALAVAVATPIVVLREIDFDIALFQPGPEAVLSGLPRFFAEWVAQVGLTLLVGVLWFDWLVGARDLSFVRAVLLPLGASATIMAGVSVYQLFGDMTFLNETVYAAGGRAGGTLYDGNLAGVIAACCLGGILTGVEECGGWRRALGLLAVLLFSVAAWASGSRTALGAALVVLAVHGWSRMRVGRPWPTARKARYLLVSAGLGLVFLAIVLSTDDVAVGPLRRFARTGDPAAGPVRGVLAELWNRNGYGAAATQLIARYPMAGIGIGGFHMFGPQLALRTELPPDNAQNWLRHQIVEMGVLGALGWIGFAVAFAGFAIWPRHPVPPPAVPARGIVLALGLISLFGMPTQEVTGTVVFWTAAAWYVREMGVAVPDGALTRASWAGILTLTLAFGVATLHAARTDLRVPVRARAIGWPYSYGFYAPEPDGEGGLTRWMGRRATALVDVHGPTMRLTVRVPHDDIATRPVDVEAWCEGRPILQRRVTGTDPITIVVPAPAGLQQVLIDLRVSRVVRPSDHGGTDTRELGALVTWDFMR